MIVGILTLVLLVGLAVAAVVRQRSSATRRREDEEAAARRIAELRALAAIAPDDIPRTRDLTRAERRRLRWRSHPIAHKRSGRPL